MVNYARLLTGFKERRALSDRYENVYIFLKVIASSSLRTVRLAMLALPGHTLVVITHARETRLATPMASTLLYNFFLRPLSKG